MANATRLSRSEGACPYVNAMYDAATSSVCIANAVPTESELSAEWRVNDALGAPVAYQKYFIGTSQATTSRRSARALSGAVVDSVRVYDRLLGYDELEWNYRVDENRFVSAAPVPAPDVNVVLRSTAPAWGDYVGRYQVAAPTTFECPAVWESGGKAYKCNGYRSRAWDQVSGDWGEWVESANETTFSAGGETSAEVEWIQVPLQKVEWLSSDGNQWINTGYHATNETRLEFRAMSTVDQTGTRTVCGARQAGDAASVVCYLYIPTTTNARWATSTVRNMEATALSVHECICSKAGYSVDGTNVAFSASITGTATYPLYIFGYNNNGTGNGGNIRMWSFVIKESGVVVRDFVPVRFTNELGQSEGAMYDRVSGQLFRNQGEGAFGIGPDKA